MDQKTLITITRQYGSGGREVAEMVAQKLGVRRYDRKIVAMAAEKLGTADDFNALIESSYNAPGTGYGDLGDYAYDRMPQHNRMYIEQAKTILKIAEVESAVFLGRCADYILKDNPNAFSFFIYADEEFRQERSKTHYGKRTLKELDAEDAIRKQYYAYYTGQVWGAPENYDLLINTSKLSLEQAAELILNYVELRRRGGK